MIIDVKLQLMSWLFEASGGQARKGKMAVMMYDQNPTFLYESTTVSGLMLGLEEVRVWACMVGLVSNLIHVTHILFRAFSNMSPKIPIYMDINCFYVVEMLVLYFEMEKSKTIFRVCYENFLNILHNASTKQHIM